MSGRHEFDGEIEPGRGGGALVEIPFPVRDVFGTGGQVRVKATFDGHPYRGSLAPMGGGVHILGIRKDVREAIGKDVGDRVHVVIELDTEPREVVIPKELAAALEAHDDVAASFSALSYTHRREFAEWVAEGKRDETRERRAARAIELIREGRTR
jgi:hypothetical protein